MYSWRYEGVCFGLYSVEQTERQEIWEESNINQIMLGLGTNPTINWQFTLYSEFNILHSIIDLKVGNIYVH